MSPTYAPMFDVTTVRECRRMFESGSSRQEIAAALNLPPAFVDACVLESLWPDALDADYAE